MMNDMGGLGGSGQALGRAAARLLLTTIGVVGSGVDSRCFCESVPLGETGASGAQKSGPQPAWPGAT